MPRKSATPPAPAAPPAPPAPPPAATGQTRKRRASKTQPAIKGVALWVGENLKPKHWFHNMDEAKVFLAAPGLLKRKEGEDIYVAELKKVTLEFSVSIS